VSTKVEGYVSENQHFNKYVKRKYLEKEETEGMNETSG
jgi:hypothetical protein